MHTGSQGAKRNPQYARRYVSPEVLQVFLCIVHSLIFTITLLQMNVIEGAPDATAFNFPTSSNTTSDVVRTYEEEMSYITQLSDCKYEIGVGFVPNMAVPGQFYVNSALKDLVFGELKDHCNPGGHGGFVPAVKQIANVAALPGVVKASVGLPDCHSGYGFAIGNVAAFDMDESVEASAHMTLECSNPKD